MKKLSELQENSEKQLSDLRNTINEQKEFFTKEIEPLKRKTDRSSEAEEFNK